LNELGCVQHDDVEQILNKVMSADAVLYGTPLYGHSYSGQLKLLMDRHAALFKFVGGEDKAVDEAADLVKAKLENASPSGAGSGGHLASKWKIKKGAHKRIITNTKKVRGKGGRTAAPRAVGVFFYYIKKLPESI